MSFDICCVISHGFSARMILHSTLLRELGAAGVRVALVMPGAEDESVRQAASLHGAEIYPSPPLNSHFQSEYSRLRRYLIEDVRGNPALWAKHLNDLHAPASRGWRRAQARLYLLLRRSWLRSLLWRLEEWVYSSREAARMLRALKPKFLLCTYPASPLEAIFLREARKQGLDTICQLLSWDNITCKGRFSAVPDHFLVWGAIMAEELQEHYQVSPQRIAICGPVHFDEHLSVPAEAPSAHLEAVGLDASKPYLFFGMSSPYFAPHEIDVVEWLAAAVNGNLFGEDLQLLVRPHPQNVQGNLADLSWLPRLDALRGPRVGLDYPLLRKGRLSWNMEAWDLPHLAALLSGCSLSLNSGSTFSLDAIAHDKPVVLTAFDAGQELPWWRSARRVLEYPHLARFISLGGVRVVASFAEMRDAIQRYLADPTLDAAARARTREQECGPGDGSASRRAAAALKELVRPAPAAVPEEPGQTAVP